MKRTVTEVPHLGKRSCRFFANYFCSYSRPAWRGWRTGFGEVANRSVALAWFPWALVTCFETSARLGHRDGQNGQISSPVSTSVTKMLRILDLSICFAFFMCLARSPTIEPQTAHFCKVNRGLVGALTAESDAGNDPFTSTAWVPWTLLRCFSKSWTMTPQSVQVRSTFLPRYGSSSRTYWPCPSDFSIGPCVFW